MEAVSHVRIGGREARGQAWRKIQTGALAALLAAAVIAVVTLGGGNTRFSSLSPTKAAEAAAQPAKHSAPKSHKLAGINVQHHPEHAEPDGQVEVSCGDVAHLMGGGIRPYVRELLRQEGHCGDVADPKFHCHSAWDEMLLTPSAFILGSCGNDHTIWELHIALAESPELATDDVALQDIAEGDENAEYTPCLNNERDAQGNPVPQTEFEKLSCKYVLLDMRHVADSEADLASSQKLVQNINKKNLSWKAKNYKEFATMKMKDFAQKKLGVVLPSAEEMAAVPKMELSDASGLPESYDFRAKHPNCLGNKVSNQGGCGSCYAFAANKVYDLSLCQLSHGQYNVEVSTQQATSCYNDNGCGGGWAGNKT
jgi:hypothetical protein